MTDAPREDKLREVLKLIKEKGPISASQIALRFSISEKQARNAIDGLRKRREPIWNDSAHGVFWWRNDHPMGHGWKRPYPGPLPVRGLSPKKLPKAIVEPRVGQHLSTSKDLPIAPATWVELVRAGTRAHWARPGIFATGVGERFEPGDRNSILYIGKSMGALGEQLDLGLDQAKNAIKTQAWMQNWRVNNPRSAFWQVASCFGPVEELSWTNVLKIDVPTITDAKRGQPPTQAQASSLESVSVQALRDEFATLRPRIAVFVSGDYQVGLVRSVLTSLGYEPIAPSDNAHLEGGQSIWRSSNNAHALLTRHPQGTSDAWRSHLVDLLRRLRQS